MTPMAELAALTSPALYHEWAHRFDLLTTESGIGRTERRVHRLVLEYIAGLLTQRAGAGDDAARVLVIAIGTAQGE